LPDTTAGRAEDLSMTVHEPATLVTDYLLGGFTLVLASRIAGAASEVNRPWYRRWTFAFLATSVASFAGGTVHGFSHVLGATGTAALWLVTMAALVAVSLAIVLASVLRWPLSDVRRRAATVSIAAAYAVYGVWMSMHPAFVFAIAAYGIALVVLVASEVAFHRRGSALWPFTWGVVVSALAAVIQQSGWTPSRYFNYNDVYHVIQAAAIWLLYRGARRAYASFSVRRPPVAPRDVLVLLAIFFLAGAGPTPKVGSPEDNLPPHITQLTGFGERASWSPDGRRIAFMSKSFGDAFVVDVQTRLTRLLTHYPHAGYLRVQYLANGDYFLIGARTFTDVRTTRARDQEMWILPADGRQPIALDHKISEGVAISRRAPLIAWSNTHGQYPDLLAPGESVIYTARIVNEGESRRLVDKTEILRARSPECTLEAQDFRKDDTELVYTCYRSPFADVFGIDLRSRAVTTYRSLKGEYNEVEGIYPSGEYALVESSRDQVSHDSNHIDIWRLKLEANSQDFVRITRWGEYPGYKASNPVVSPDGRTIAFQSARTTDEAGVGYGIFLLNLQP
jgi:hypothetical protein